MFEEGYAVPAPWWLGVAGESGELWIGVTETAGPEGGVGARAERVLVARRPVDGVPVALLAPPGAPATAEGWRTVDAGLVRVGPANPE